GTSAALGSLSSLPSSEVVSSEEFHMSHRHHLELSDRRLSDALPPFGPLQKRSTAPTHLSDHLQGRDTRSNQLRSGSEGSRREPSLRLLGLLRQNLPTTNIRFDLH